MYRLALCTAKLVYALMQLNWSSNLSGHIITTRVIRILQFFSKDDNITYACHF